MFGIAEVNNDTLRTLGFYTKDVCRHYFVFRLEDIS